MFTHLNKLPNMKFFGDSALQGEKDTKRFLSYGEQMNHLQRLGVIRHDDPRMSLDPQEIAGLSLRTFEGLQRAADNAYAIDRSENRMQSEKSIATSSIVRAALASANRDTPEQADTDRLMGKSGVLARRLEEAALHIATTYPKDPNIKRLLTIAAAAHTVGAKEATLAGFDNGSVIEAAATQNRDPLAVMADMKLHKILDHDDPRAKLTEIDVDISKEDASNRIKPVRPQLANAPQPSEEVVSARLGMARRAEGRAMAMAAQQDGTPFEQQSRKEEAHKMLAGAFAAERYRQVEAKQAKIEQAPSLTQPIPAKRRVFGGDSR